MVRVGVPDWAAPGLLNNFSDVAEVIRIPPKPPDDIDIDFWIPPLYPSAAARMVPRIKGICVAQSLLAGVDWLLPIVPQSAKVCDAQGVHNIATAEWVITAILSALKYIPFYAGLQRAGDWVRRNEADEMYRSIHSAEAPMMPPVLGEELHGKTVMIVGYGSIGKSIEELLAPFGVNIIRVARNGRAGVEPVARLHALLPSADVVVLIVPLTPDTIGMIDATALRKMRKGALLINAARGPVVETGALVGALQSGCIRAVVDVTDPEPLPEGHALWRCPNLLITPHVAASSPMFMVRAFAFAALQLARYVRCEPLENVVTGHY
jgi:phosphoglycerate dehydrogenase-like enzyme